MSHHVATAFFHPIPREVDHCGSSLKMDQFARHLGEREIQEDAQRSIIAYDSSSVKSTLELGVGAFKCLSLTQVAFR